MRFRALDPVEDDLVEAAWWYEQRQNGLGEMFLDAYELAVRRVIAAPTTFARLETNRSKRDIRRCALGRFPHYIMFEITADELIILAVAHPSRRPNYFLRRE